MQCNQRIDNLRIGQSRHIAHVTVLSGRNPAQDSPHDLARPGLRQTRHHEDLVRRGDRPNDVPYLFLEGANQLMRFLALGLEVENDIGEDALPLDLIWCRPTPESSACRCKPGLPP